MPSKALLRAGKIRHLAARHGFAGIQTSAGPIDHPSRHNDAPYRARVDAQAA